MASPVSLPLASVVESLFGDSDLGDVRRDRRFRLVARAIADRPGASLPQIFPDPSAHHACLRRFDAPECTRENILGSRQAAGLNALDSRAGTVLLLHDATRLDFSGRATLRDDLGPIGNGGGRGWTAHHTLAVDPADRAVLGLVSQILHVRVPTPKGETVARKRDREGRESRLWLRGLDEIGPTPAGCHRIDVADRGADIFEFLQALADRGRHFVVRSKHNRATGAGSSEDKAAGLLHDLLRGLPATARWALEMPPRGGQPGRTALLSGVSGAVTLRPPHVRKGAFRREPLAMSAVRVWEASPPAGATPLEWLPLTGEPAGTPADIERTARTYACRMQIEAFHTGQKSGMSVEGCQVQSAKKMGAVAAVLSVIAVALTNLRLAVRDPGLASRTATDIVPAVWVEVLSRHRKGRPKEWTVAEFWHALARLGGHLKNPVNHPPGWITLWRGWVRLHPLVRYHLSMTKM